MLLRNRSFAVFAVTAGLSFVGCGGEKDEDPQGADTSMGGEGGSTSGDGDGSGGTDIGDGGSQPGSGGDPGTSGGTDSGSGGQGAGGSGGSPAVCDPEVDTDDDGLDDCREIELGTAVHLADTDGDGFTDGEEVIEFGFSPKNNNFKFNPRIADTPRIKVDITSPPSIALLYESSSGEELSHQVERSVSSSRAVTSGSSSSTSHAVEYSETVGTSVTVGVSASFPGFGASAEATVSYESSMSSTEETSFEWSEEQTQENESGLAEAEQKAATEGTNIYGGVIAVTVDVENAGDLAFTLDNLSISAHMSTPSGSQILSPVGGLNFDTSQTSFPKFTYGPGQRNGPFVFLNDGLDVGTVESLLADSTNLHMNIVAFELTDENNRSFTHNQTAISARTATVLIDWDSEAFPFSSERYQVATNADAEQLTVSAKYALEDILRIPYAKNEDGALTELRGIAQDLDKNGHFAVVHKSSDGILDTVQLFSPKRESYDFDQIELKSGDILHIVYIEDEDGDGLGRRQEEAYGSSVLDADTDGDGLADGDEVNIYHTLPASADTDRDGVNDSDEVLIFGSDPDDPDTNKNGISDADDMVRSLAFPGIIGFAVAVTARGNAYIWGKESTLGKSWGDHPVLLDDSRPWRQANIVRGGVLLTDADGVTYALGDNTDGRLGLGGAAGANTLTVQAGDHRFQDISCQFDHCLALEQDGGLWGWGNGPEALGVIGETTAPVKLAEGVWTQIAASWGNSLALRDDGTLWATGTNLQGQLGLDHNDKTSSWTQVGSDTDWAFIAIGRYNAGAIKEDGSLYLWGRGPLGLGQDDGSARLSPTQIGSASNWTRVSLGENHIMGVQEDGTLWGWGHSYDGDLMGFSSYWVPTRLGSDTDWWDVSAGYAVSAALRQDRTLSTWGSNFDELLGRDFVDYCSSDPCSTEAEPVIWPLP